MTIRFVDIEDLLARNQCDGLSGKGASEEEISRCEQELEQRLPESYRQFLRRYGWGYFGDLGLIRGLGADIPVEWLPGTELTRVALDERNGPLCLPVNLVPFNENGAGDWYALDLRQLNGEEAAVVFVSHEHSTAGNVSGERVAESFAEWVHVGLSGSKR